ncbi:NAD-dependent epimerase/dehydratase family protein [Bradyrhizobium jicamae]|uniref:NAD-dependent epimerase/dehydratase family protein n=1 Tax=Bradyrhizobium jicamae TaxID=280332 RepID=A0ABS5FI68_9BRAD|nr:NAD-dependent epimerase/dehydratase family protein [Bradyrhizobium jicamae]MBR0796452.1 NAD-dependent epimerase/dehydratase family protein [Bradyrhizobium jicamae]
MSMVLVTGGSGFIGVHVILQLLAAGHEVRTTVRNLDRARDVVAMLREGGADAPDKVGFLAADLMRDEGWRAAAAGCDYVMHVASPLLAHAPEDENELIVPAREGTLRVLRAARDAGARRVVVTSSFAAIGYGYPPRTAPFDETSWTNLDGPDVQAYPKSKTLAERAAWDFIGREGNGLELAVVNPVAVFGPALGPDFSESIGIIRMLLEGAMPAVPRINLALVDVRDVADLHLRAMTSPEARGERFLAVAGETMSVLQIARVLRARLGAKARRVPRFQAPDWMLRLAARRNPMVRAALPLLGKVRQSTSAKVATAESLIRLGLVKA